jgi:hypothetical protein
MENFVVEEVIKTVVTVILISLFLFVLPGKRK